MLRLPAILSLVAITGLAATTQTFRSAFQTPEPSDSTETPGTKENPPGTLTSQSATPTPNPNPLNSQESSGVHYFSNGVAWIGSFFSSQSRNVAAEDRRREEALAKELAELRATHRERVALFEEKRREEAIERELATIRERHLETARISEERRRAEITGHESERFHGNPLERSRLATEHEFHSPFSESPTRTAYHSPLTHAEPEPETHSPFSQSTTHVGDHSLHTQSAPESTYHSPLTQSSYGSTHPQSTNFANHSSTGPQGSAGPVYHAPTAVVQHAGPVVVQHAPPPPPVVVNH